MSVLVDSLTILQSNWGWLVVVVFFVEQLFNPFWETRLQTILNDQFATVEDKIDDVDDKLDDVDEKQTCHIQVTRALASKEAEIDEDVVDEYLVENGIDKADFYVSDDPNTPIGGD